MQPSYQYFYPDQLVPERIIPSKIVHKNSMRNGRWGSSSLPPSPFPRRYRMPMSPYWSHTWHKSLALVSQRRIWMFVLLIQKFQCHIIRDMFQHVYCSKNCYWVMPTQLVGISIRGIWQLITEAIERWTIVFQLMVKNVHRWEDCQRNVKHDRST